MGRTSKLTEREWEELIKFYDEGHSMTECSSIWNVTAPCISVHFKKIGKKARGRFEPSRPEKLARMPDNLREAYLKTVEEKKKKAPLRDPENLGVGRTEGESSLPRKRKIISLKGNEGEGRMLYEKEVF